jgi:N-acetylmuramoyl-L-alanine amidase
MAALSVLPTELLAAASRQLEGLRLSHNSSMTRLVFDLSGPVEHSVFTLSQPERVVIDIESTALQRPLPAVQNSGKLKRIRHGVRNGGDLRVVADVHGRVRPRSFLLKPNGKYGWRLVVDLHDNALYAEQQQQIKPRKQAPEKPLRNVVVAIDAGHGGKDPGAVGPNGTHEKDITLAVALRLEKLLKNQRGITPVLIRKRDKFVSLRERVRIARSRKADLFVSIHADAFRDRRARGSSVYALSLRGASSEAAKWIANKENAADLFGDVSLNQHSDLVASVLLDLAQKATIQSSLDVGENVLGQLKQVGRVHKHKVEQAGFAVLRSPDIPSILVETAFISNPLEERKLRTRAYQSKLALAMQQGVVKHFAAKAPPGTVLSGRAEPYIG